MPCSAQHAVDQRAIAGVADHERRAEDGVAKAGAEIVEHDDVFAAFAQLPRDVAADVAGAAGDEDRAHDCGLFSRESRSRVPYASRTR